MTHAVLIPEAISALNIDSYNRTAVCASALDNGNIVKLTTRSATAGESEVFTAVVPSTGNGLTDLWMVYSGDEVIVTDARYKGIDPDPRNFFNAAAKPVSVYKPALGDIILMTGDGFATGSGAGAAYANAVDTTGGFKLEWAAAVGTSILSYKLLATKYISLATGAIDSQRVVAYELECVVL
jgi:hypothetical protein